MDSNTSDLPEQIEYARDVWLACQEFDPSGCGWNTMRARWRLQALEEERDDMAEKRLALAAAQPALLQALQTTLYAV